MLRCCIPALQRPPVASAGGVLAGLPVPSSLAPPRLLALPSVFSKVAAAGAGFHTQIPRPKLPCFQYIAALKFYFWLYSN